MARRYGAGLILAAVLLSLTVMVAAQVTKKAQQADIRADKFVYHLQKKEFVFTGNCRVDVKGPDKATLRAPRMVGTMGAGTSQISQITAEGPVTIEITTAKASDGTQQHIMASCKGTATYSGATRVVTLAGGAEAVMTTLPEQPDQQPTRFTGDKLVVNFGSSEITGENVHFEVEVPANEEPATPPAPEGGAAPAPPAGQG